LLGIALKAPQRAQLGAGERMRARRPALDPADVKVGRLEVDLIPTQVDQLGNPETVPECDENHCAVPMARPILLCGLDQALDLGLGQVLAGAQVSVRHPERRNCSKFGARQVLRTVAKGYFRARSRKNLAGADKSQARGQPSLGAARRALQTARVKCGPHLGSLMAMKNPARGNARWVVVHGGPRRRSACIHNSKYYGVEV
jgi:hypothetical protein